MKTLLSVALTLLLPLAPAGAAAGAPRKKTAGDGGDQGITLRMGHFPNVTHAHALVARSLAREGKGWFQERLGADVKIDWYTYNAGPSAMEGIFTRAVDLTYVGPSPAINAFARSRGREIRIVSGAVDGGSALVVHKDSPIKEGKDFRGRKLATPQLGNTQDVSARAWLTKQGLTITQSGGDAFVIPTANPDQLPLFRSKRIDGVWTVEPWVSRLIDEADGRILVNEKDAVTTVLVASSRFLKERPELVEKIVQAHHELTDWINANPEEAQRRIVEELSALTRTRVSEALVAQAWPRMTITNHLNLANLEEFVQNARSAGFLRSIPPLSELVVPQATPTPPSSSASPSPTPSPTPSPASQP